MIDPTKTLAVCEAATEGPWRIGVANTLRAQVLIPSVSCMVAPNDATFIAQARTELPAYAAFVRDVLALHVPGESDCGLDSHVQRPHNCPDQVVLCLGCDLEWPCPTVQLAAKHGIEVGS